MNKFKKLILFINILLLTSCGTLKEGFKNQKKNNSDEFLVEKKSPLVMPPNYNELPIPTTNENVLKTQENEIKTLISKENKENILDSNTDKVEKDIEKSLLDKIRNN